MGMKDKGGRAFGSGNALMGALPYDGKLRHKPVTSALKSKQRAETHRASKTKIQSFPSGMGQLVPVVNDPFAKGNFLMGW